MNKIDLSYSLENILCSLMALDIPTPLCDFKTETSEILNFRKFTNKSLLARILVFSNQKKVQALSESLFLASKAIYNDPFLEVKNLSNEQVLLTKNYFKRFRYFYYLYFHSPSRDKSLKDLNTVALRMLSFFH